VDLLDDFEDGDLSHFRGGVWSATGTGSCIAQPMTVLADNPTWGKKVLRVSAQGVYPILGSTLTFRADIGPGYRTYGCMQGIQFAVYASQSVTVWFQLESPETADGDHYGVLAALDPGRFLYTLPVTNLHQQGWGAPASLSAVLGDCTAVSAVVVSDVGNIDLLLDEVLFIHSCAPIVPTSTPTSEDPDSPYDDATVAAEIGCSSAVVAEVRALGLPPTLSFLIMRLTVLCGCSVSDLMVLRRNLGWDDVCAHYGIAWKDIVDDLKPRLRKLRREPIQPSQILRGGTAHLENAVPYTKVQRPVPTAQVLLSVPYKEVCP